MSVQSEIEGRVGAFRRELDVWLDKRYPSGEREYSGELDAGYEGWSPIEEIFSRVFDDKLVQSLSEETLDSLLFFIARTDECGRIIAWISPALGTALSNIGKLREDDFLFLCQSSLARGEDYCDYQLANCFRKFSDPKEEYIELLLRFFDRKASYTRRIALDALVQHRYPDTVILAIDLWNTDECEFARLTALYALKNSSEGEALLQEYLGRYEAQYDVDAEPYRPDHMERLKSDGQRPHS